MKYETVREYTVRNLILSGQARIPAVHCDFLNKSRRWAYSKIVILWV